VHLFKGGQPEGSIADQGVLFYEDTKTGFSFEYPGSWLRTRVMTEVQSQTIPIAEVTFGNPNGATDMGIAYDFITVGAVRGEIVFTEEMRPLLTAALQDYVDRTAAQATGFKLVQPVSEFSTNGLRWMKVEYLASLQGHKVHAASYLLVSGQTQYQINVQAIEKNWEKDKPQFDAAVQSFRLTDGA
jgi:hypothetical protein